jgi:uncharacterized protein
MNAFSGTLLHLIDDLRAAEVPVSVAETLDAMRAAAAAGIASRTRLREALASALVKDEGDRASFDEAFARTFGMGAGAARGAGRPGSHSRTSSAGGGRGESSVSSSARTRRLDDDAPPGSGAYAAPESDTRPEKAEAVKSAACGPVTQGPGRNDISSDAAAESAAGTGGDLDAPTGNDASNDGSYDREEGRGRERALRRARRTPFASYTALEYEQAREALAPLARRLRLRLGRRLHIARRGRIDFRRTIRASLQHGGAMPELRFRARRPRHVDLVVLADVSGSVRYCSTLLLELAAGTHRFFRRVHSFIFIDSLVEAEFSDGHVASGAGLDPYARSDFGRVLGELWERRAGLITRTTLLLILGDARNNRRPARTDLLRDLRRMCRAVVWLNPEPVERWGAGDSAINQYAREINAIYACGTLGELARCVESSLSSVF